MARSAADVLAAMGMVGLDDSDVGAPESKHATEEEDDEFLLALRAAALADSKRRSNVQGPEAPRWAFKEMMTDLTGVEPSAAVTRRSTPRSGAGSGSAATRAKPAAVTAVTDDDAEFFDSLAAHRNYYFISRLGMMQHHVSVRYCHEDSREVEHVHFTGADVEHMRRQATMVRGPCCNHIAPVTFSGDVSHPDSAAVVSAVSGMLPSGAEDIHIEYIGRYQELALTEFIVRTPAGQSVKDELKAELEAARDSLPTSMTSTPKDDLERLDLDMMLSCLGPSRASGSSSLPPIGMFSASRGAAPPVITRAEEAGMRAISMATMSLCLNQAQEIVNRESYWKAENVDITTSSLGDLHPRKESFWVKIHPSEPGSLQLRGNSESELRSYADAAIATMTTITDGTFESQLHTASFIYGNDEYPIGYRETRALTLSFLSQPAGDEDSLLEHKASSAESHHLSIEVPICLGESDSTARASKGVDALGITVEVVLELTRGRARLIVSDASTSSKVCIRPLAGRSKATAGGSAVLDSVGLLKAPFYVVADGVVNGKATKVVIRSGSCDLW